MAASRPEEHVDLSKGGRDVAEKLARRDKCRKVKARSLIGLALISAMALAFAPCSNTADAAGGDRKVPCTMTCTPQEPEDTTEAIRSIVHVKTRLTVPFEAARKHFEAMVPRFDVTPLELLSKGEIELGRSAFERAPELSIFLSRDHGTLLKITGQAKKATQYEVGNPLTASKMTRYQLPAALYAPFRVLLYEDANGRAVFEYDKPSLLFGQFGDEQVTTVAQGLDAAIADLIRRTGNG